jgi:hypothetical protein
MRAAVAAALPELFRQALWKMRSALGQSRLPIELVRRGLEPASAMTHGPPSWELDFQ